MGFFIEATIGGLMTGMLYALVARTTASARVGLLAGAVYALNLKAGQVDTSSLPINSEWVPVDMAAPAALVGEDLATADALGNLSNADKIAKFVQEILA